MLENRRIWCSQVRSKTTIIINLEKVLLSYILALQTPLTVVIKCALIRTGA